MYVGLGFSLIGVVLYDPLGLLFQWHRADGHRARSNLHAMLVTGIRMKLKQ